VSNQTVERDVPGRLAQVRLGAVRCYTRSTRLRQAQKENPPIGGLSSDGLSLAFDCPCHAARFTSRALPPTLLRLEASTLFASPVESQNPLRQRIPIECGVGGLGTSQDMILVTALALHSGTTVMPLFTFALYATRNQKFDTDAVK
jgi:hypothetical protein